MDEIGLKYFLNMYFRVMIKETIKGTVSRERYCLIFVNELLFVYWHHNIHSSPHGEENIRVFPRAIASPALLEYFLSIWRTSGLSGVLPEKWKKSLPVGRVWIHQVCCLQFYNYFWNLLTLHFWEFCESSHFKKTSRNQTNICIILFSSEKFVINQ